jgi:tagatose 1,6-diphosphate aldolase
VEEFTKPEYKVDILKVEFPANLKFTEEYKDWDFYAGESAYTLSEVEEFCQDLDAKSTLPWVILSAGVDIEEFIENVKISSANGASGFLCGRAIWKDAVPLYPDKDAVTKFLLGEATVNFENSNAAVSNATPWFNHKRFGGLKNIELDKKGENWYEIY